MNKINKLEQQSKHMAKMKNRDKLFLALSVILLILFGTMVYFTNNNNSIQYAPDKELYLRDGNYFVVNYFDQSTAGVTQPDVDLGLEVKIDGNDRPYITFLLTTHDDTDTFEFIIRVKYDRSWTNSTIREAITPTGDMDFADSSASYLVSEPFKPGDSENLKLYYPANVQHMDIIYGSDL